MAGQERSDTQPFRVANDEKKALEREKLRKLMSEYIFNSLNIFIASLKMSPFSNTYYPTLIKSSLPSPDDFDVSFGKLEDIFKEMASRDPNFPLKNLLDKEQTEKGGEYTVKATFAPILAPFKDPDSVAEIGLSSFLELSKIPYSEVLLPLHIVKYSYEIYEYNEKLKEQFANINLFLNNIVPNDIEPLYQVLVSYQSKFGSLEQHDESEKFKNAQISMTQAIFDQIMKGFNWEQLETSKNFMPFLDQALNVINTEDLSWLQPRYSQLADPVENPETARFNLYLFKTVYKQLEDSIADLGAEAVESMLKESGTDVSGISSLLKDLESNANNLSSYWGTIKNWADLGMRFDLDSPIADIITVHGDESDIQTDSDISRDFVSPGERGHIPTKEEMEKIKSLQQIPIMINNSAESMSKIKSNTKDAKDNTFVFSHTLSDVARYAGQIGGAFMNVNEEIGKVIMSAGTLTEGVAGIFKAFEGDKVNGLGLMSGIQGGFAGLQGLFGGEPGSDSAVWAASVLGLRDCSPAEHPALFNFD